MSNPLSLKRRVKDLDLTMVCLLRPGDFLDVPSYDIEYSIFLSSGSLKLEYEDKTEEFEAPFLIIPETNKKFKLISLDTKTYFCFINVIRDKKNNLLPPNLPVKELETGIAEGRYKIL